MKSIKVNECVTQQDMPHGRRASNNMGLITIKFFVKNRLSNKIKPMKLYA